MYRADQRSIRSNHDQASAGKQRPGITNQPSLGLGVRELRQLREPPDLPALPVNAKQLGIVGGDENPVAGNPRRVDSSYVDFPQPLPGQDVERDHAPALPDRDHLTAIDYRVGIDVIER